MNGSPEGVEEVKANLGAVGRKGRLIFEEPGGFSVFIQHLDEQMERFRAAGWD
ncbi:MAG: hypothetical protein ACLP8S_06425 [Solirubrobacteraceae bacterium]